MERKTSKAREYLEAILIAVVFLRFVNTFVVQTFYIPSPSMEETLLVGDHLFVNRFIYGPVWAEWERSLLPLRPVHRGDIVIFRSPENPHLDVVKRCVGLPGDRIEIVNKELFINGAWIEDASYTVHRDRRIYLPRPDLGEPLRSRDNFGPFTVPEGHYFCLGDNRDESYDSRYWGGLPAHLVKGRALLIYWSYGGETSDGTWRGLGAKLRQLARTALGFFTKTRWGRSFRLVR